MAGLGAEGLRGGQKASALGELPRSDEQAPESFQRLGNAQQDLPVREVPEVPEGLVQEVAGRRVTELARAATPRTSRAADRYHPVGAASAPRAASRTASPGRPPSRAQCVNGALPKKYRECASYGNRFADNTITTGAWTDLIPPGQTYAGGAPCSIPSGQVRLHTAGNNS